MNAKTKNAPKAPKAQNAPKVDASTQAQAPEAPKAPKPERAKLLVQNGMQKPGVGTIGCRIWDLIVLANAKANTTLTSKQLHALPELNGELAVNVASINARYRVFNGIRGRLNVTTPTLAPPAK
jgi:hypothetical protein